MEYSMTPLNEISERKHEQVVFFHDHDLDLRAIIAVHDTTLGPSLGGCRMRAYASLDEALSDVLRLSEAMTYKNSLCGINIGGGKSVILRDGATKEKRSEILSCFARWVESLGGKYITAEDMGTSVSDMSTIFKSCRFVTGKDPQEGGGGDPSPYTALGIFEGTRACLERAFGSGDYRGRHFAVQGVGHVGSQLVPYLAKAGAEITISDINETHIRMITEQWKVKVVSPGEITRVSCDVFSPCAAGGTINAQTVNELQCKIVAGAANNQIDEPHTERQLAKRGILYAPDFAINAGGVILCASELEPGGYSDAWVRKMVLPIYHTVGKIFDEARRTGELPGAIAVRLAKERIEKARAARH